MCKLPNSTGFSGFGETSWDSGDVDIATSDNDKTIAKANQIPILTLLRAFNIRASDKSNQICCPFPSHKNGQENTPSLIIYPHTNSYNCFGCKQGRTPVHFIKYLKQYSTDLEAAEKIVSLFDDEGSYSAEITNDKEYKDKFLSNLEFSTAVREFNQIHFNNAAGKKYIDEITIIYEDLMIRKPHMSAGAIEKLVDRLIATIKDFT